MTRVHLVRHGRTASNRERRTMGWLDEGIEPGWVRAAAAVAHVLAQEPVDWLVSSPLARAVQTAAPLAAQLGRQAVVDDRFGELLIGHWEGYGEDEIAERWPEHWQRWPSERHASTRIEASSHARSSTQHDAVCRWEGDLGAQTTGVPGPVREEPVRSSRAAWFEVVPLSSEQQHSTLRAAQPRPSIRGPSGVEQAACRRGISGRRSLIGPSSPCV